jgi:hypothetical protein
MKHLLPSFFFSLLSLFFHSAFSQTQVTISASKDNTLIEDSTGSLSNGAGPVFHAGRVSATGQGTIRRGLIAFDVAGSIPPGATIQSVVLTLNMSQTNSGAQTVGLHRVLEHWGEGTSSSSGGSGAPATNGDATWLHTFFDTTFWSNAGGDYSPMASGSQSVSSVGTYTWGSTPEMVSDVQQWLDNPSANFGWVMIGNESVQQTSKRFDSKDNANPSVRPQLQITYDPPVSVGEQPEIPATFSLSQNYPNPFNPSTTIVYRVPSRESVSLKVYNLLGQEVATLVNEVKQAGRHEVKWNAGGLPSGMYVYRLQAGGFGGAKKLLLLR